MSEIQYIDGLIVKAPNPKAPEYVKASISIKRAELIAWLQSQSGEWINADVKVSKSTGKWYAAVNDWKPDGNRQDAPRGQTQPADRPHQPEPDDDFPF